MIIDFENLTINKKYSLMSNTIFPRPIAWISTENDGVVNLAPFSYFAPISSEPPCVIVSITHKEDGDPKDTLVNILKHKKCTINLAHKELLKKLQESAEELPKDISEPMKFGIEMQKIVAEYPPMVKEAKCALFCKFVQSVDLHEKNKPLILEIEHLYIEDGCRDEKLHIKLENIGRVGMDFLVDSKRVR
ncbi:MAG: flavin reductase family protein [Sulfurimonadaceae bacterium]|jgi:flavin reductase (DIM6/NTAB) family NADH-FMN oxidoreductase RutF|nr:flavin reductase family protein [Sulfurimonadaceae bacterium]